MVFLGNQLSCFVDFKMASQWIIMVPANQLGIWQSLTCKVGPGGTVPYPRFLLYHLSGLVLWSSKLASLFLAALVAVASGLQCWPTGRVLLGLACLGDESRIDTTAAERESRRWRPGRAKRDLLPRLGSKDWDLQYLPLFVRAVNDEDSGSAYL